MMEQNNLGTLYIDGPTGCHVTKEISSIKGAVLEVGQTKPTQCNEIGLLNNQVVSWEWSEHTSTQVMQLLRL